MATLDQIDTGIVALGTTQGANPNVFGTTYAIGRLTRLSVVGTSTAAANALTLPINPVLGAEYRLSVPASCAYHVQVFPAPGTTNGSTATINGMGAGIPVLVGLGGSAKFTCIVDTRATGATWLAEIANPRSAVIPVAAAITLNAGQSGATIAVSKAAAYSITLPTPFVGAEYTFVQSTVAAANTVVIDGGAGTTLMLGGWINTVAGTLTGATTAGTATRRYNFLNPSVLGDTVNIKSDGTNWYCVGMIGVAAGASFS